MLSRLSGITSSKGEGSSTPLVDTEAIAMLTAGLAFWSNKELLGQILEEDAEGRSDLPVLSSRSGEKKTSYTF